jgi:hypothetical protein
MPVIVIMLFMNFRPNPIDATTEDLIYPSS